MEEAIELVVASIFQNSLPFSAPCSRISGFMRFLRLLSDHDWMFTPLIVDINEDMTPDDEKEINVSNLQSLLSYLFTISGRSDNNYFLF